jgi:hypothetical protein
MDRRLRRAPDAEWMLMYRLGLSGSASLPGKASARIQNIAPLLAVAGPDPVDLGQPPKSGSWNRRCLGVGYSAWLRPAAPPIYGGRSLRREIHTSTVMFCL